MGHILRKYLKGAALTCAVFAPLCMLLEVFMDLQQPTLMSTIIDTGVANGDLPFVLQTGLRMILFAFIGVFGGAGCSILAAYASNHTGGAIRKSLFAKIQSLSFAEIDHLETSSLITRTTNDVSQMENMLASMLRGLTRAPMLCIGGIIMSFRLDPQLALILCVVLPVLFVCALFIMKKATPMFTTVQEKIDDVNTVMRENLLGIRVVKAFTMQQRQFTRFSASNDSLATNSIRAQSATFILMPVVTLLMNLSVVAILWFGGNMEIAGALPSGKIIAFVNYMVQIMNSMIMMVNFIVGISRAQASAKRINEVLNTQPSITQAEDPMQMQGGDIEFSHVDFRYNTGEYVLRDVSFTIKKGQKVGIIGATGCGKSSLVALIARLYDVTGGSVKIGGVDVRDIPLSDLRDKVGMVLQESLLFSGSVLQNLRFGDENASDEMVHQATAAAQAETFLSQMPDGLESKVEQRGKNFSGGQKQRLSIARTLLKNPDILIMDDSTSAVDLATEAKMQSALRKRMQGSTLILIAQRISAIMDCDAILVMDSGRLYAMGNHDDLMQTCDIYRSIAVSQLGEEMLRHG